MSYARRHTNVIQRTVCVFGTASFAPEYVRNRLLVRALEHAGYRIIYCTAVAWTSSGEKVKAAKGASPLGVISFLVSQFTLLFRYLFLTARHDAVLVAAPGHLDMPLARAASWLRRKPLIFDVFYSLYDTVVSDRGLISPESLRARLISFVDGFSCRLADRVLIDTRANRDFICSRYRLDKAPFAIIPAGAPEGFEDAPEPAPAKAAGICTVLFHGSYVPLQGAMIVAEAAARLANHPEVRFRMIGDGQTKLEVAAFVWEKGLQNVDFVDWLPLDRLREEVCKADICLGIFGTSGKALRVVPHKVFAALAQGRPVITSETEAALEWLEDRKTAVFCRPGDPEMLAGCIMSLSKDARLRTELSNGARKLFMTHFHIDEISRQVDLVLRSVMHDRGPGALE
jgi:glycosyltransferase involved in cell wall biosynthesis